MRGLDAARVRHQEPVEDGGPGASPAIRLLAVGLCPLLAATVGCVSQGRRSLVVQSPNVPAEASASPAKELDLRLLTFNVWGLPSWINGASGQRFPHIADGIEGLRPDVVALQEVWTRQARAAVPAQDGWWMARPAGSWCYFRRCGLVTLSRHRIVSGEFRPFRRAQWPDALVCKGAMKTTIELAAGVRINLWNVHLQAGTSRRASALRGQQIQELSAWEDEGRGR